jgi:UDP-N-acetylglucosamine 1-carboxyvinyltransferase
MKIILNKGDALSGEVSISGSKNSSLPALAALLLSNDSSTLKNVPEISDTEDMISIIKGCGYPVTCPEPHALTICPNHRKNYKVFDTAVGKLRGSYYLMGALLGRCKKVIIRTPGGCNLGARPIDYHLDGFKKLGAKVRQKGDLFYIKAHRLKGAEIIFPQESVGATINIILAAVKAKGMTVISNASLEPEVLDVIELLQKMGASIKVNKNQKIEINGVKSLKGTTHTIIPDRIEAGSYLILAGAMEKSNVTIKGANYQHLITIITVLRNMGLEIIRQNEAIIARRPGHLGKTTLKVGPYPFLPTDLQQILTALMLSSTADCSIEETIFNNRFSHIAELIKMGAKIRLKGQIIHTSPSDLTGCDVIAHDLRCAMSLIVAGCMAKGETVIHNAEVLLRGYENPIEKLRQLGIKIRCE